MKIKNISKLDKDLKAANIPIFGVSSDERIDFKPEATEEQKELAEQLIQEHCSYDYAEIRRKFGYPPIGDQLDILYKSLKQLYDSKLKDWDGVNEWFDAIAACKNTWKKEYEELDIDAKKFVDEFYEKGIT